MEDRISGPKDKVKGMNRSKTESKTSILKKKSVIIHPESLEHYFKKRPNLITAIVKEETLDKGTGNIFNRNRRKFP